MMVGHSKEGRFMEESLAFCLCVSLISLSLLVSTTTAKVVLIGNNVSLSFYDIEANFAPRVKESGVCGIVYLAEPLDACSTLTNEVDPVQDLCSPFALIIRGGCTFDDKVKRAQRAGFKAAIIYDNEDNDDLVAMAGSSSGIKINAVFISKASGEVLKKYVGFTDAELWIIPTTENSACSILVMSFISLFAICAMLGAFFFVRRFHITRERDRASHVWDFHGMSSRLVKAMPSLIFTVVLEDNCTSRTCAICLEDYSVGEKLRVLPCCHKFHAVCVDSWLTTWRPFCPICKRDARTSTGDPSPSECTPLLSSGPASSASLSSFRSSLAASPSIQIATSSLLSPSVSHGHSLASTPCMPQSRMSYNNSPAISFSRSSMNLRNASSQRSLAPCLVSSHSLGYPSSSPINSRYISPYFPSSSNASPSYLVGSSSLQPCLLRCGESATSMSPFTSAQSLPER